MEEFWQFNRFTVRLALLLVSCLLHVNLELCWSLNSEGLALLRFRERVVKDPFGALLNWKLNDGVEEDHCSWFGVGCSVGKVVSLDLKDLSLEGTLAPEIRNLVHIKSINLRNNSFSGIIPIGIGELKELKVLDLGYNNFSEPLPSNLGNEQSLAILLLDNNKLLHGISSELWVDEKQQSSLERGASSGGKSMTWSIAQVGDAAYRRLLQVVNALHPPNSKAQKSKSREQTQSQPSPSPSPSPSLSPSPTPSSPSLIPTSISPPLISSPAPAPTPDLPSSPRSAPVPSFSASPSPSERTSPRSKHSVHWPPPARSAPVPSFSASPSPSERTSTRSKHSVHWPIISGAIGASFLSVAIIGILLCRSKKVVSVKPWVTGLSGQLQKAFVTGVPKLKRSELETACEDFSNIIGSSPDGTMYKGTLSSGVEIAVTSPAVTSTKDWSKHFEGHFRKKIDVLSKVNHKNFVNVLGFCEEEQPFTRMMVFEYAPNGTLFEHLHIKEAEHLDWGVRLRIAMGMAYCLDHMHQLDPPVILKNLQSNSVYLTEDYAAKISDTGFWNEATAAKMGSAGTESLVTPSLDSESNIYSFGVILLEMITGRLPYCVGDGPLVEWASVYLRKKLPVREMVDPTLKTFNEEELEKLCEVIRSCINDDPKQRPTIKEVTARLREITAMSPDGATPKLSPLWWAELEILSTEAT